ncbi:hypothetical protein PIB30_081521, partial [Stylosanthes scabra]|nr:hypothetical protein [Stylosanthes scabra]
RSKKKLRNKEIHEADHAAQNGNREVPVANKSNVNMVKGPDFIYHNFSDEDEEDSSEEEDSDAESEFE